MKHVLIITPGFPADELDYICLPFLQLYILELMKQNIEVSVITDQYPRKENYKWNSVSVFTLRKKEPSFISKLFKTRRLKKVIQKINQTNKIDIVHKLWFDELVKPLQKITSELNLKLAATFTGQDVLSNNKSLQFLDEYRGELVCVSSFQNIKLTPAYQRKIKVIEWGIEPIEKKNSLRKIDIIFAGSLNAVKNHRQFIEIITELNKSQLLNKVVVCGNGEGYNELQKQIKKNNLEDIVELKGSIDRREVLELMQQSKILLHTSNFESFGLVLAEGLASGCIVVAKPIGLAYDNDTIIKCETTEEFISKIKHLLHNNINIPKNKKEYLMQDTVKQYLKLFNSL
jgi:glycosyltransferase involved in cell wall biosynthesis